MILHRVEMLLCPGIACGHIGFARNGIWFWAKDQPVISCRLLQLQKRWFTGVILNILFFMWKKEESRSTGGVEVSGCGVVMASTLVVLGAPGKQRRGGGRFAKLKSGKRARFRVRSFYFLFIFLIGRRKTRHRFRARFPDTFF
jgi:hypothetical protein